MRTSQGRWALLGIASVFGAACTSASSGGRSRVTSDASASQDASDAGRGTIPADAGDVSRLDGASDVSAAATDATVDAADADDADDAPALARDAQRADAGVAEASADGSACPGPAPVVEPTQQIFVGPSGSDTAAGTQSDPLASLGAAAKLLPGGGTIVVLGGTYGAQRLAATGVAGNPLVIRPASGAHVVFDGSSVTQNYGSIIELTSAQHVVIESIEVENGTGPNVTAIGADQAVTDVTIRGCKLHDVNGTVSRFAGDTIEFDDNEFYNGALVNVNGSSTTGWPTCMGTAPNVADPTSPWPTNVVIRGNYIHDCWGEGIGIWYGSGVVVENNVVVASYNVGIYLDNASSATVERNFVTGVVASGNGIFMGVEPYTSWGLAYVPDHDVTIENNVVAVDGPGVGIGWWTSPNTSPNNSYANVSILQNTVISTVSSAIGFEATAAGAVAPGGCTIEGNVLSEKYGSTLALPSAFSLAGNAWLNEPKPSIAGASDVSESIAVPSVTQALDVEPLAAQVGQGVANGVTDDFLCQARAATPTRGAFEH